MACKVSWTAVVQPESSKVFSWTPGACVCKYVFRFFQSLTCPSTVRFGWFVFPAAAFLSSPVKPGLADCFQNRSLPERERENPAPACAQHRRAAPTRCPPPSHSTRSAQQPPACFVGNKILGHVLQQTYIYTKPG